MSDPKTNPNQDYNDFLSIPDSSPSIELDQKVLRFVHADLSPSLFTIWGKLVGIQTFIGILTMTFCPQFNMSLTNSYELFHFFHHTFGEIACMVICGSIFMGSGAIFASYILRPGEIARIKNSSILNYFAMTIIAMGIFLLCGAEFYLKLHTAWFLGAALSGALCFQVNQVLRHRLFN